MNIQLPISNTEYPMMNKETEYPLSNNQYPSMMEDEK